MKVVLATFGSLGDLHPMIAIGIELKHRGHDVTFAAMEYYREKLEAIGFTFAPIAPHMDPTAVDTEEFRAMVDAKTGPEKIIGDLIMPALPQMYDDLLAASENADVLITGELIYAAKSVVEKTGIKWVSTTLAPISLFSAHDPGVPPQAPWFEKLRFLGPLFHRTAFDLVRWNLSGWFEPYKKFRADLGLEPNDHPLFEGKFSDDLHLVLFSRALGKPQPDWPKNAVQTGFCFYDGQADTMPDGLDGFLDAGEPPIVFTLGSAAVMDARNFFEESAKAARNLNRRAVLLYGTGQEPPKISDHKIAMFEYAPYSRVFPRAACVVHQGGVGTTGQVLRAGVPQLVMPYGHDQHDNAARCRRIGVAEIIGRDSYNPKTAAHALLELLSDPTYRSKAEAAKRVVDSEGGTQAACDSIESLMSTSPA
ncbi:MAG TPA: glycosyltransferase [Pyrinomonadaceae bacterium]|nr:glycosyltransferase [Pyrinomonadaceae bacterium]